MQSRSRLTQNTVYASMGVSKTAAKKDDPTSLNRDLKGAPPYKKENISYITNMLGYLSSAMELLKRAVNDFTSINSDSVSPDGMLGGKGHVMGVRDIKTSCSFRQLDILRGFIINRASMLKCCENIPLA